MTPQGHPARSNPGQIVGPDEAVVLMRRTRAYFIKARTHRLSIERPDIYTQPCIVVHRVTRRRCTEGWVHISICAQPHLTPTHSSQLQPMFRFWAILGWSSPE